MRSIVRRYSGPPIIDMDACFESQQRCGEVVGRFPNANVGYVMANEILHSNHQAMYSVNDIMSRDVGYGGTAYDVPGSLNPDSPMNNDLVTQMQMPQSFYFFSGLDWMQRQRNLAGLTNHSSLVAQVPHIAAAAAAPPTNQGYNCSLPPGAFEEVTWHES